MENVRVEGCSCASGSSRTLSLKNDVIEGLDINIFADNISLDLLARIEDSIDGDCSQTNRRIQLAVMDRRTEWRADDNWSKNNVEQNRLIWMLLNAPDDEVNQR